MAQTRTGYVAIDDTQVDAESPITESLMTALRDQWYAALSDAASAAPDTDRVQLPERAKCDAGDGNQVLHRNPAGGTPIMKNVAALSLSSVSIDTSLRLQPNGAGGVAWGLGNAMTADIYHFSVSGTIQDLSANEAWHCEGFYTDSTLADARRFFINHDTGGFTNLSADSDAISSPSSLSGSGKADGAVHGCVLNGAGVQVCQYLYSGTTLAFSFGGVGTGRILGANVTVYRQN